MIHRRGIKLLTSAGLTLFSSFALVGSGFADPNPSDGGKVFVENGGQWNSSARYLARFPGLNVWVTDKGAVYDFFKIQGFGPALATLGLGNDKDADYRVGNVVSMEFAGQDAEPTSTGLSQQEGFVNYLVGKDSSKWASGLRRFGQVRMSNLYQGVDMVHYIDQGMPRYDLVVAPGTSPSKIRMSFKGAEGVSLAAADTINLETSIGTMSHSGLYAYQVVGGKRQTVESRFVMVGQNTVGVELGLYDKTKPVVIDPLVYSSFIGGNGDDAVTSLVVNNAGTNAYLTGYTTSTNFPTKAGAYSLSLQGTRDAFVSKVNNLGTGLAWSTYLGGSGVDVASGVAFETSGNTTVVGSTNSTDFPTTAGAFQSANGGGFDAFVTRLNSTGGALLGSTYVGGTADEDATAIKFINNASGFVICGRTASTDFPTTVGAIATTFQGGDNDAFVTRVAQDAKTLAYSTYLGGTGNDSANGIGYEASGYYVAGQTTSSNFPTTLGVFQSTYGGNGDGFVTKINAAGSALVFSSFIGGSGLDYVSALSVRGGAMYLGGTTDSHNYPVNTNAIQPTFGGGDADATYSVVAKDGTRLIGSTYLGGSVFDAAYAITFDANGNGYIAGVTYGGITATPEAFDSTYGGAGSGFITKLPAAGNRIDYQSYFGGDGGGTGYQSVRAIGLYGSDVWLAGVTNASDFPTVTGSFQTTIGGAMDGFVSRLTLAGLSQVTVAPAAVTGGTSAVATVVLNGPAPVGGAVVNLTALNAAISVPATVTVPEGQVSADFTINTSAVDTTVATKVKATRLGVVRNGAITVSAATVSSVTFNNPTIFGGSADTTTGTATINGPAGPSGVNVTLSSNNNGVAMPGVASVLIPAGSTSANFAVIHHATPTAATVTFSGTVGSDTSTGDLTVNPYIPTSLTSTRYNFVSPQSGTGTVKLNANAPAGGTTVTLSSDSGSLDVPASVTVAAGTDTATFPITSDPVNGQVNVTVGATFNGTTSTMACTLKPFVNGLSLSKSNIVGGQPGLTVTATVTLQSNAVAGGQVVTLTSSNTAVATVPASVTVPEGTKTATFTVTHFATTSTQTSAIKASAGGSTKTANLTVTAGLLTGFTLDHANVWGASSDTVTGTVTINGTAPTGGTVVQLGSSATGAATVPNSVTIAAGTNSKTFTVTHKAVVDDTTTTITATGAGGTALSNDLLVKALKVTGLTLSKSSTTGGTGAVTGTVTINGPAAVGGTVVALNSSDTTAATVPATVTVAAGASTATFNVTPVATATDKSATITASLNGSSATQVLAVKAAVLLSVSVNPTTVVGGSGTTVTGTVTFDGPAPTGGRVVTLSSSLPGTASVPATVTVAAGATSATFTVSHFVVAGSTRTVTITAVCAGVTKTCTLQVSSR